MLLDGVDKLVLSEGPVVGVAGVVDLRYLEHLRPGVLDAPPDHCWRQEPSCFIHFLLQTLHWTFGLKESRQCNAKFGSAFTITLI